MKITKKNKMIVANWKMNIFSEKEAKKLIGDIKKKTLSVKNTEVVFCVNPVFLSSLTKGISKNYKLGVQNISSEEKGSYTGETSVLHIKPFKVSHSIIGHSERRKMGESDILINKKVKNCLNNGIVPIVCIGEEVRDENGNYLETIKNQIKTAFSGVSKGQVLDCVVAYEPVWAIGASQAMKPEDVFEMYLWVKKCLKEIFGSLSENIKVLYGGAVDDTNASDIFKIGNIDGFLVGRASLDANLFSGIIKNIL
jgi:triosephosphate isomerase